MLDINKAKGAFYGAVLGDVIGVPYEFKSRTEMASLSISIEGPPTNKTYPHMPSGVWSDDTSLMLCVADAIVVGWENDRFGETFTTNMMEWYERGKYTSNGAVFDVGGQTLNAIRHFQETSGKPLPFDEDAQGNGALMRTLPCAFLPSEIESLSAAPAHTTCTHRSKACIVSSSILTLIQRRIIGGDELMPALQYAIDIFHNTVYQPVVDEIIEHGRAGNFTGSGWVFDSLNTAIACVANSTSTIDTITAAIRLGDDTDTTAAIAGSLAGALYGYTSDLDELKNKVIGIEQIDQMWLRLETMLKSSDWAL